MRLSKRFVQIIETNWHANPPLTLSSEGSSVYYIELDGIYADFYCSRKHYQINSDWEEMGARVDIVDIVLGTQFPLLTVGLLENLVFSVIYLIYLLFRRIYR